MATSSNPSVVPRALPPGQRRRRDFPRFGQSFRIPPPVPDDPILTVTGEVERELRLPLGELIRTLPRVDQIADFHCVATWSATGLRWSGVSFRQFWEEVLVPRCRPAADAVAVFARGADGVRAVIDLRDALGDDVMLADRLDGRPLDGLHGAPLRFVSPGQYGYKNIKHLTELAVTRTVPEPGLLLGEHRRARVAFEERDPYMNAQLYRLIGRALIPPILWLNRRSSRKATGEWRG